MPGDIDALIERVKAATGADREVDVALWYALHPDREELWSLSGMNAQRGPRQNTERDLREAVLACPSEYGWCSRDDAYTASLDAALTLVERVLKAHAICVESFPHMDHPSGHRACAHIHLLKGGGGDRISGATPPLALLAALLAALKGEQSDGR